MTDATTLIRRAAAARRDDRLQDAREDFVAAVNLCRRDATPAELVRALKGLGQIERDLGRHDAARALYEEAVTICRTLNAPLVLAHTVRHLGDVHQDAGRAELAGPCYAEALRIYRTDSRTPPLDLANAIRSLAVHTEAGGGADARKLWEEARDLYAAVGILDGVAECTDRLAEPGRRSPDDG